jgi:hypothetical protein
MRPHAYLRPMPQSLPLVASRPFGALARFSPGAVGSMGGSSDEDDRKRKRKRKDKERRRSRSRSESPPREREKRSRRSRRSKSRSRSRSPKRPRDDSRSRSRERGGRACGAGNMCRDVNVLKTRLSSLVLPVCMREVFGAGNILFLYRSELIGPRLKTRRGRRLEWDEEGRGGEDGEAREEVALRWLRREPGQHSTRYKQTPFSKFLS